MTTFPPRLVTALVAVASIAPHASIAQEGADELAKKLSNPVASLISVPLQYNIDFDIGSENGTKQYLNVQPVIPHGLNDELNLITRVIVPVIYQDDVFGNSGDQFGLGERRLVEQGQCGGVPPTAFSDLELAAYGPFPVPHGLRGRPVSGAAARGSGSRPRSR